MITRTTTILFIVGSVACEPAVSYDIQPVPDLSLQEEMRIGSRSSPTEGFAQIGGMDVGKDGRVYVLERQAQNIRVFSPEGEFERIIGRRGAGPGEFESIIDFGIFGDTLWFSDRGNQRLTLLRTDGTVLKTTRTEAFPVVIEDPSVRFNVTPAEMRRDGSWRHNLHSLSIMGYDPSDESFLFPRLIFDGDAEVSDTLGHIRMIQFFSGIEAEGESIPVRYSLPTDTITLNHQSGIFRIARPVADQDKGGEFQVTRLTEVGDTIYDQTFTYLPHAVDDAFIQRVAEDLAGPVAVPAAGSAPSSSVSPPHMREIASLTDALEEVLPEFHPPVSNAVAGEDGQLWLRREDLQDDFWTWWVIDPNGVLVGKLQLPKSSIVHWIEGNQVWVEQRDEFDVPWLIRYRYR